MMNSKCPSRRCLSVAEGEDSIGDEMKYFENIFVEQKSAELNGNCYVGLQHIQRCSIMDYQ